MPHNCFLFDLLNLLVFFKKRIKLPISGCWRFPCFCQHYGRAISWWMLISEKNIFKIVFHALSNGAITLSNGAIGVWLWCSGAKIYRFLMVHLRKNILYFSICIAQSIKFHPDLLAHYAFSLSKVTPVTPLTLLIPFAMLPFTLLTLIPHSIYRLAHSLCSVPFEMISKFVKGAHAKNAINGNKRVCCHHCKHALERER